MPVLLTLSIPLGLSLLASTNPSSWTYFSAATLWVALYASFEVEGRRRWGLWALALVMALTGSGSRADSALFCVMAVGLVLLLRLPLLLRNKGTLAVMAGCVAIAAAFFTTAGQATAVSAGFVAAPPPTPILGLTIANIQQPGALVRQPRLRLHGQHRLAGHHLPAAAHVPDPGRLGGRRVRGAARAGPVRWPTLAALGFAITVYPLYLLAKSHLPVGQGFQPRYVLPILVILTGVALLPVAHDRVRLNRTQALVAAVALALAHVAVHADPSLRHGLRPLRVRPRQGPRVVVGRGPPRDGGLAGRVRGLRGAVRRAVHDADAGVRRATGESGRPTGRPGRGGDRPRETAQQQSS